MIETIDSVAARLHSGWREAHRPVAGVPPWARIAALAIPYIVLPSCVWRVVAIMVDPNAGTGRGDVPSWLPMPVYVVLLSLASEMLAFLGVGLIARWGEAVPRWIPGVGGRRVATAAAAVPATLGAIVLTFLWTGVMVSVLLGVKISGEPLSDDFPLHFDSATGIVSFLAYAPLVLWGPLLGAVTLAYVRRRVRTPCAVAG